MHLTMVVAIPTAYQELEQKCKLQTVMYYGMKQRPVIFYLSMSCFHFNQHHKFTQEFFPLGIRETFQNSFIKYTKPDSVCKCCYITSKLSASCFSAGHSIFFLRGVGRCIFTMKS